MNKKKPKQKLNEIRNLRRMKCADIKIDVVNCRFILQEFVCIQSYTVETIKKTRKMKKIGIE